MSNLLPGESLVIKAHPHWITFIRSLIVPAVLVIAVLWADFSNLLNGTNLPSNFRALLALAAFTLAGLWLIVVWIRWRSTAYTLTDQRIKIETGVFGRQEKVIPIDRVQDCTTRQSIFGRMLGYGRVEVDAAGAQGAEILDHLPSPGTFRDQVFVQSEKRRGGGMPAAAVSAHPSGL